MHPTLFRFGPVTVSSFFVLALLAFLAAAALAVRRAKAVGLTGAQTRTLAAAAAFSIPVGARMGYLVIHAGYYRRHPAEILRVDQGGLMLAGGLLAALLSVAALLCFYRKPVLATVDRMIPPLVLAQSIARLGCFLQGCCYGRLTHSSWWGLAYPPETVRRHPTQLLESGALLLLFFFLLRVERSKRWVGTNLLWYGLLYGAYRFAADFLRADSPRLAAGLKLSQWMALPLALFCCALLIRRIRRCTPSS